MPISFEEIEAKFVGALEAHSYFENWRKKGKRIVLRQVGDYQQGVELIRFKASFENIQWIAVCAFVSYPHAEKPLGYVSPEVWKGGRMFVRAYVVPGSQMTDQPTFGSGACIKLQELEDLDRWASGLASDLSELVLPWLRSETFKLQR